MVHRAIRIIIGLLICASVYGGQAVPRINWPWYTAEEDEAWTDINDPEIMYYFQETNGAPNIQDSTANNNDATLFPNQATGPTLGTTVSTNAIITNAVVLTDGSDDIVLGASVIDEAQGAISLWFYTISLDNVFQIWFGSDSIRVWHNLNGTNAVNFTVVNAGTNACELVSSGNFATGTWHNVFVTWKDSDFKLYVNGALEDSCTTGNVGSETDGQLQLGRHAAGNFWNGYADDFRYYEGTNGLNNTGLVENIYNFTNPLDKKEDPVITP
jgi:hypothetical protein